MNNGGDGTLKRICYDEFLVGEDGDMGESDDQVQSGVLRIQGMAAHDIQSRVVLIELVTLFRVLPRKEAGYDELIPCFDAVKVELETGDILCLWTGLDRAIPRMKGMPGASLKEACVVLDGRDPRLLNWINDSGVAAIASDNLAVEAVGKALPDDHGGTTLPLHRRCLFELGVPLGELWHLAELASWLREHGRSRFLLTAPPLRLTGAVGSPATPIATV